MYSPIQLVFLGAVATLVLAILGIVPIGVPIILFLVYLIVMVLANV
jgi:hypothetical protein